jgi:preprotein translocase subunit SecA
MYSVQIAAEQDVDRIEEMRRRRHQQMMAAHTASRRIEEAPATVVKREADKVGRNDPCPCGSGKKYKKCHGTA